MLQLLVTLVVIVWVVSSALANDEQDCFQAPEPQLRIKGCSDIIERAPDDATAYLNRAFAYGLVGDVDNAIADYSKVIALAPSNASAYANRGRAYASRGDHVHATEDEIRAHELIAKAMAQPLVMAPKTANLAKKTASVTKPTPVQHKGKGKPNAGNGKGEEGNGWWSWLWGNNPGQAGGKSAKH
jgi:tetratricopeptide (TPR) repeat protein